MSGVDAGLPDTYGRDPDELAELLQTYRDRYATVRGPSPSERADRELAAASSSAAVASIPCARACTTNTTRHTSASTAVTTAGWLVGGVVADVISEGDRDSGQHGVRT